MFETVPTGIVISDAETGRLYATNEAFEEITGYPLGEVIGRNPRILAGDLADLGDLRAVHERLHHELGRPITVAGQEATLGTTTGAAPFGSPEYRDALQVEEAEDLVRYADQALYRAKDDPESSFHLFRRSERDEERGLTQLEREQDLRGGMEAGEIVPYYQPVLRLSGREVWGFEALARWRHPERACCRRPTSSPWPRKPAWSRSWGAGCPRARAASSRLGTSPIPRGGSGSARTSRAGSSRTRG